MVSQCVTVAGRFGPIAMKGATVKRALFARAAVRVRLDTNTAAPKRRA